MPWYFYVLNVLILIVTWQLSYTFLNGDGKVQLARFRNACCYICDYIEENTKRGTPPISVEVIHKNKIFKVGILAERTNSKYYIYRIFINGEEAAKYHVLCHLCSASYEYEAENQRDRNEVESIIFATRKMLKKQENPKPIPESKAKSYFN